MNILTELSIGSVYQNIAFYTLLTLLASLNFDILKYLAIKRTGSIDH